MITAAVALAACGALVLYGVLSPGGEQQKKKPQVPTASVTYEVTGTGTADITYQARSKSGKATVVKAAALPWSRTVPVPLGRSPIVSIVLGKQGGQARCAVAVRGQHLQSATASGGFGRATCTGTLPNASPSPDPADASAG
ncbi:MmpS family transport accessory protein [Streptomyces cadmiisoli]|uniref:MmpS family transport accessory protein n=1 Tax=Streptomyces cadmiisoli TaxID=2184053 RepID=UPI003659A50A